jgi:hypothetical protein
VNNKISTGSMVAISACVFVVGASVFMCSKEVPATAVARNVDTRTGSVSERVVVVDDYVKQKMELAYLYGQSDALSGDIRVAKNDSVWYYTRTPWDSPNDSAHQAIPDFTVPIERLEKEDPFSIKY